MASRLKCFVSSIFGILVFFSAGAFAEQTFPKKKIQVGSEIFEVEVAQTPQQLARGLMFRPRLAENEGMLFIFEDEQTRSFWMKNTLIDLSIGFFDKNQTLVDVQEMKSGKGVPDSALKSYLSVKPAKYALEMNTGWFDKKKIKIGTKLRILP